MAQAPDREASLVAQVPAELHRKVRAAALRSGKTMRTFVIEALDEKLRAEERADAERRAQALADARALFAHVSRNVSLVDELIAERRKEARREQAETRRYAKRWRDKGNAKKRGEQ